MTKHDALRLFRVAHPPESFKFTGGGTIDHVARQQEWNDYTDTLCKEGQITAEQYHNWTNPF